MIGTAFRKVTKRAVLSPFGRRRHSFASVAGHGTESVASASAFEKEKEASLLDSRAIDDEEDAKTIGARLSSAVPGPEKVGTDSPWAREFAAWGCEELGINERGELEDSATLRAEYAILSPRNLRLSVPGEDVQDLGAPAATDQVLGAFKSVLEAKSRMQAGYPYNLQYDHRKLSDFLNFSINNLGDPFEASNYGIHSRAFEQAVVDFFSRLWHLPISERWGYVTTCGSESNLHGILLGRETQAARGNDNAVLYASRESHYSIFKAARYFRMNAEPISTLPTGEIDLDALAEAVTRNMDGTECRKGVVLNINVGTTVKGAVDSLGGALKVLDVLGVAREDRFVHCDGALFALMLPFLDEDAIPADKAVSFLKDIDSMSVSGHKMLGCPMPCGVQITKKKHVRAVEQQIEYLNSVDTTIMGSRNGHAALFLWHSLREKGIGGIRADVEHSMQMARLLRDELRAAGISANLNALSSTVVMERPACPDFILRWQLACERDIAHVVLMPNHTPEKLQLFVRDFCSMRKRVGEIEEDGVRSPLALLRTEEW